MLLVLILYPERAEKWIIRPSVIGNWSYLSHVSKNYNTLQWVLSWIWWWSKGIHLTPNVGTIWQHMTHLVCVPDVFTISSNTIIHELISSKSFIPDAIQFGEQTYKVLGQRSFMKLVCMNPGSRQPTVRAGEPEVYIREALLHVDISHWLANDGARYNERAVG